MIIQSWLTDHWMSNTLKSILDTFINDCKSIKISYGSKYNISPLIYEKIYNKLDLPKTYKDMSNLNVLELYPGPGVSSFIFHDMYKPKKQLLMEPRISFVEHLKKNFDDVKSIQLYEKNPYLWESFIEMTDHDKLLIPTTQSRDHINDEFLIMANLTDRKGEQLYMQYLQCIANRNWMHRFGLVKMLVWVPQMTSAKLLAPIRNKNRARCSVLSEAVTDTRLIATTDNNIKCFTKEILDAHDPILIPEPTKSYSLIEVNPKEHNLDLDNWEYVVQRLMIMKSTELNGILELLGHGAHDYFVDKLDKSYLKMTPSEMSPNNFSVIADIFNMWPFKPTCLIDFYEQQPEE